MLTQEVLGDLGPVDPFATVGTPVPDPRAEPQATRHGDGNQAEKRHGYEQFDEREAPFPSAAWAARWARGAAPEKTCVHAAGPTLSVVKPTRPPPGQVTVTSNR